MQGVAAHDLIEHEDQYLPHGEARASMVGSPPRARLAARARKPEPHLPSLTEKELGESLRADPTERAGHPGVPCDALPAGHAHRLPDYKDAHTQHPEDAEAPLLVDVTAGGGTQQAGEQQEQQQ